MTNVKSTTTMFPNVASLNVSEITSLGLHITRSLYSIIVM
nr:MAG TPA: hypothetical protein [Caudoviricetes sp.]